MRNALPIRAGLSAALLSLAMLLSACGMTEEKPAEPVALSDAEIIHAFNTLNAAEIRQAQLALQKSDNLQVQETARQIIIDHTAMTRRAQTLAQEAGLQPQPNPVSEQIQQRAQQATEELVALSGTDFDRAYLQKQMQLHQTAVDTVQQKLLPDAQNPELIRMLTAASPMLEQHLIEARRNAQELRALQG